MLKEETENSFNVQQYVVLLFNEIKVMAKFVLDKTTGELISFSDLQEPVVNFGVLERHS